MHPCARKCWARFDTLQWSARRMVSSKLKSNDKISCRAVPRVFDACVGSTQAAKSIFPSQPDVKLVELLLSRLSRACKKSCVS